MSFKKIIAEYPQNYCRGLELAYGKGMMSEGGTKEIEQLFSSIDINNSTCLDIGSGLGGVAIHLAKTYAANITGLEINPWMVEEATKRIPPDYQSLINFQSYDQPERLPFADQQFDIVYSKGVLVHVQDKQPLFNEIHRVLQPDGYLIINDWLSPLSQSWGRKMQSLCEVDNLSLFAHTQEEYCTILRNAGFTITSITDRTLQYQLENAKIVKRLNTDSIKNKFIDTYGVKLWQTTLDGFVYTVDAMKDKEVLVKDIIASPN